MKLWLASTDAVRVHHLFGYGVFAGVLTNPATLAAAARPPEDTLRELCAAIAAPVFHQLRDGPEDELKKQADRWLALGWTNLGIKVALTANGCRLLHWLREQRVALRLATAVTTPADLLLATALDVPWVTPSGSALEKLGGPSKADLLAEMQELLDRQKSPLRLIPSLASPAEWCGLARHGLTEGFIWDRDAERFLERALTREVVDGFDGAWQKLGTLSANAY
jgi:hypothetical protein